MLQIIPYNFSRPFSPFARARSLILYTYLQYIALLYLLPDIYLLIGGAKGLELHVPLDQGNPHGNNAYTWSLGTWGAAGTAGAR